MAPSHPDPETHMVTDRETQPTFEGIPGKAVTMEDSGFSLCRKLKRKFREGSEDVVAQLPGSMHSRG